MCSKLGSNKIKMWRMMKLGYQAFREAIAASFGRPYPAPLPTDAGARYLAMWESYVAKRQDLDDYDHTHAIRFRQTVKVFGPYLSKAKSVLELGGHSRIGVFARDVFGIDYRGYEGELRDPYDLPSDAFDVVLCLEVLEHLKDARRSETTINDIACWNYSGVMNLLQESYRVMKPGGVLLVTTPNAASVDVIGRVLAGDPPQMFNPHVRELAPRQVKAFAELVGFQLELFGTYFAWGECSAELREKVLDFITSVGFDPSNRGDDAYYVLQRPDPASPHSK